MSGIWPSRRPRPNRANEAGAAWAIPLLAALLLYGLFSSSTPDAPGWAEAAVGILLVFAVGPARAAATAAGAWLAAPRAPAWAVAATLALGWLLWVPLLRGAAAGWRAEDIVRDIVPVLYLFLPLFLLPVSGASERMPRSAPAAAEVLAAGIAAVGVLFAARFFLLAGVSPMHLGRVTPSDGQLYLPSSPAVLFAGILLPLFALERARPRPADLLLSGLALAGGLLCLTALAATLQRSALGAAAAAFAAYAVCTVPRQAGRLALAGLLCGGAAWFVGDWLLRLWALLVWKTQMFGGNQHIAEIAAAAEAAGRSVGQALFGAGWGALVDTPAAPGFPVSYLHALPLYVLVKAGVLGLAALTAYAAGLVPFLLRLWRRDAALFLATAAPLLLGAIVQPTFKFLTYGLLLALPVLAAAPEAEVRPRRPATDPPAGDAATDE